jgi:hypothetical protein
MRYDLSGMTDEEIAYFKEHGYPRQAPEVEAWMQDYARKLLIELQPHQALIDQRFKESRDRADQLFSRDHDAIGRILKHHLILENYITRHLEALSPRHDWRNARLRFAQKIALLPKDNPQIQYLIPGIREINDARNVFGHRIEARLSMDSVKACLDVLELAHPYFNKSYTDPIDVIQDFTQHACASLFLDKEVQQIFKEAHARVKALPGQTIAPPS